MLNRQLLPLLTWVVLFPGMTAADERPRVVAHRGLLLHPPKTL